ncbi:hypothetical protein T484DRAFT_2027691 [Baffinella frigidus]|nr:hypothetical protein T484DRAFT_2027691 [Cryptophyta sp. CCMP2293]
MAGCRCNPFPLSEEAESRLQVQVFEATFVNTPAPEPSHTLKMANQLDHSHPARPDATRHSNAPRPHRGSSQPTATTLRTSSHLTATKLFSRSQSAVPYTHGYTRLHEDEDRRTRDWENAEKTLTSAFFLAWAASVILLGGWHAYLQI